MERYTQETAIFEWLKYKFSLKYSVKSEKLDKVLINFNNINPIVVTPNTRHKYFINLILEISLFSKIPFFNLLKPAESTLDLVILEEAIDGPVYSLFFIKSSSGGP